MAADLDLDLLVPDGRTITVTVDGDRCTFPLTGLPSLSEMIRLMRIERDLLAALGTEDVEGIAAAGEAGLDLIHEMICQRTPEAPRPDLNTPQIISAFRFLAGDDSIAESVSRVLTGGDNKTLTPEELAELEARGETPLASTQP